MLRLGDQGQRKNGLVLFLLKRIFGRRRRGKVRESKSEEKREKRNKERERKERKGRRRAQKWKERVERAKGKQQEEKE